METTTFTDQELAQERFDELLEEGNDSDEMKEFIETHGHKDFALYYEDYARMVDQYDQDTVTDGGYIQTDLPYWIAIDWEETWENLSYDYSEANGFIFSNNW